MNREIFAVLTLMVSVSGSASNFVVKHQVGEHIPSAQGSEVVIAQRGWQPNEYYVSQFSPALACQGRPDTCTRGLKVVGPRGTEHVANPDNGLARAAISEGEHPVAVVVLPGPAGRPLARAFRFVDKVPVEALRSPPLPFYAIVADCATMELCANEIGINFDEAVTGKWPDIILRQTAARMSDPANSFRRNFAFTFSSSKQRYVRRPWTN